MVKSFETNKGNLANADSIKLYRTISHMIQDISVNAKLIVLEHDKVGGAELLDYTIKLFE
ncbi:MAG: hypothetical protein QNK55_08315 [Saprospiraceae bacterium]|tara:strand:+ start:325 stop:504 length:180 start_codon:yes stop_codon:yes gene_type:complete